MMGEEKPVRRQEHTYPHKTSKENKMPAGKAIDQNKTLDELQVSFHYHMSEMAEVLPPIPSDINNKLEELAKGLTKNIQQGQIIEGTIVDIGEKFVAIDIGMKVSAILPKSELNYLNSIKIGDKIEVVLLEEEDETGRPAVSHTKARRIRGWEKIVKAHENKETLEALVKHKTKGGVIAEVETIECFMPNSQIDEVHVEDPSIYIGKKLPVKVIKINFQIKNVVVSHKAYLEEQKIKAKEELLTKYQPGYITEGIVKNITRYGVFVSLGDIDGMIHIKDLTWHRINHPSEYVRTGQKIKCIVLDFSKETGKLLLGHKQLLPHPWEQLPEFIKVGNTIKGTITQIKDYGILVEVAKGIEGLVPITEVSWEKIINISKLPYKIGDEIEVKIIALDKEKHKLTLSRKALIPDPWTDIDARYPIETIAKGKVIAITQTRAIIQFEPGVEGELDIKDVSWTKVYRHMKEALKVGDDIEVMIMEINRDKRILKVSKKHTESNPWLVYETIYKPGSEHEGVVSSIGKKEAVIYLLPHGAEAICKLFNLRKENGQLPSKDEKLLFRVINFDPDAKIIEVSHTATYKEQPKKETKERTPEKKAPPPAKPRTTIGEILKQQEKKDKSKDK